MRSKSDVFVGESAIYGKGVFARRDFRRGEAILDIDDSHVVTDPSSLTREQHDFEVDYLARGKMVIMQPPERYINHSCEPNSYVKTTSGVRRLYAMRDIREREEITLDYSINGYGEGTFECNCASDQCRGVFRADFFKLPASLQIEYLPYLDDWFKEEFSCQLEELEQRRINVPSESKQEEGHEGKGRPG